MIFLRVLALVTVCGARLTAAADIVWAAETSGTVIHDGSRCNSTRNFTGTGSNGSAVSVLGAACTETPGVMVGCVLPGRADAALLLRRAPSPLPCGTPSQALALGIPPAPNSSAWVGLVAVQRPGSVTWSATASALRLCDVDLSLRRVSTSSAWFFRGINVAFDSAVECLSLPVPLFDSVVRWTNATCAEGSRAQIGTCSFPHGHSLVAELPAGSDGATQVYWRLPLARGGRQCVQAHNTSEWETVRVGRRVMSAANATLDLASMSLRLPTTTVPDDICARRDCPEHMVYAPRSDSCVDASCLKVWFKQTVDGECRNRGSVVAVVSLLVALISTGEIILVYARRQLDMCVSCVEARQM